MRLLSICLTMALLVSAPSAAHAGETYLLRHLTKELRENGGHGGSHHSHHNPQIDGTSVVWESQSPGGGPGSDSDIFWFDGATVTKLTNGGQNHHPQISGNHIVWSGNGDGDWDIYRHHTRSGAGTQNLSNSLALPGTQDPGNFHPQVDGSRVVWESHDGNGNSHIYHHENGTLANLSGAIGGSNHQNVAPQIDGDWTVWSGNSENPGDPAQWSDIYMHHTQLGSNVENLSGGLTSRENTSPQIDASHGIVWQGGNNTNLGGAQDIYLQKSTGEATLTNLTNNSNNYSSGQAQISGSDVVWVDHSLVTGDSHISLHQADLNSTVPFPHLYPAGGNESTNPQIDGNHIVWTEWDGGGPEHINHFDGSILHNRTDALAADYPQLLVSPGANVPTRPWRLNPQVSGANLVWEGGDWANFNTFWTGGAYERDIYAAFYAGPYADLTRMKFIWDELREIDLKWAWLQETDWSEAMIQGTNFSGANLWGATGLGYAQGIPTFSHQTMLPDGFDAHSAGWNYVTPEPSAVLLALLGLCMLPRRRRR